MRNMFRVAQQQLERMSSLRKRYLVFSLTTAKMDIVVIARNRLVQGRQIRVDQQVVMSGMRFLNSSWRRTHAMQTKQHDKITARNNHIKMA